MEGDYMEFKAQRFLPIAILMVLIGMVVMADWGRNEPTPITNDQQALSYFIFDRLEEGYDSWEELVEWTHENEIPYSFSVYEGNMSGELIERVHRYGPSGDFIEGARTWRANGDPELTLFFENLTYNKGD